MPIQAKNQIYFTTPEAAQHMGVSEDTVRTYVKRKLLSPAKRIGRSHLFTKTECDRYTREKRKPGRQPEKNS